ncbi:MAG: T9SS type A sorting domain-containing protein [candidate division WOR-3 bacterium]
MIYINSNNYGLHPRPGIGGSDYGWNSLIFPLNSLAGRDLQFRITFFSTEDGGYSKEGLYIDDFYVGPATGIAEGPKSLGFSLSVSPNPAKGKVKISFTVPDGVPYSLKLYDPAGRMVGVIHEGPGREGPGLTGEIHWEPDLRPGVYFLRLEAGGRSLTEKMMVW